MVRNRIEPQTPAEWRGQADWARRKAQQARYARDREKFLAIADMAEATAAALERAAAEGAAK